MTQEREAIAAAAYNHNNRWPDTKFASNHESYQNEWRSVADAVIAHLWQRAFDPEVLFRLAADDISDADVALVLGALIGPKPSGEEAEK